MILNTLRVPEGKGGSGCVVHSEVGKESFEVGVTEGSRGI